jgi:hypothetical protein
MSGEARHQVFVSSTFRDLIEERRQVMQALLELDCMPAGMELFPASDDDSWTLIRQVIDESDYYIVIVGGRYGSVHETGLSYTRMEYEYALGQNKPVLGFLHADPDSLSVSRSELSESAREALSNFRDLVSRKQCRYWTTPEELGGLVSRSIIRLRRSHPRPGWVRADTHGDLALRERIVELESQILALRAQRSRNLIAEDLSLDGGQERTSIDVEMLGGEISAVELTWNEILLALTRITLDLIDQEQLSICLSKELIHGTADPNNALKLSVESMTRIIIFMLASGVLERRQTEYRLTQTGIGVAANLQLRTGVKAPVESIDIPEPHR